MGFQQGDRVVHRSTFDWSENPGRAGTFVAGPGVHESEMAPGNSLVIGDEYAVVQFDDAEPGQAQVVRLDALASETSGQRAEFEESLLDLLIGYTGSWSQAEDILQGLMNQGPLGRVIAQVEEWETLAARPLKNPACDWAATHAAQIRIALRGGE